MPFHIESSPNRVCPKAPFAVTAKLNASRNAVLRKPERLARPKRSGKRCVSHIIPSPLAYAGSVDESAKNFICNGNRQQ